MTIEEAQAIIAKTNSPHLKRDMIKFIKRQRKMERHGICKIENIPRNNRGVSAHGSL
jgi:hypothetical protein